MNRETLIAIFLGFTGGILVAFLLITVPKKLPQAQNNTTPTPAPEVAGTENQTSITLSLPEEGGIIQGEETEVEGITSPNSKVVISGPTEDIVVEADDSGSFSGTVNVYEGYNQINITVFTKEGQMITQSRNIFATVETL